MNPGSQLIQIAGVDYLSELDHFVKEDLRVRGYGRYMDDLVLVHRDEEFLDECLGELTRRMARHHGAVLVVCGPIYDSADHRVRRRRRQDALHRKRKGNEAPHQKAVEA